eukprot:9431262-Prorocentrum_lima.AAC.1
MAAGTTPHVSQHVHQHAGAGCEWCMDAKGLGRRGKVPDRLFGLQCFFPSLQPGETARSGMAGHGSSAAGDDGADTGQ